MTKRLIQDLVRYLQCSTCKKRVSSGYIPYFDTSALVDDDIVVRAWIQCPECIEKENRDIRVILGQ